MTNTIEKKYILILMALVFAGWHVVASPVVEPWWVIDNVTFDDDLEGWTIGGLEGDPATSLISQETGVLPGADGGYTRIDVASGPEDLIYFTPSQSAWTDFGITTISFDFYADTAGAAIAYPSSMYLYIATDNTTDYWLYDISDDVQVITGTGWYSFSYTVNPLDQGDWVSPTASDWTTTMGSVNEVGIWLTYPPIVGSQIYGLDNFSISAQIPEPGSLMMLGSALLSLSMTFRKKISARARELLKT